MFSLWNLKYTRWDHANDIDNELKLFSLISSGEEWESSEELDHYASHAPHVNGLSVWEDSEHDLGGAVEPTLDVSVNNLLV